MNLQSQHVSTAKHILQSCLCLSYAALAVELDKTLWAALILARFRWSAWINSALSPTNHFLLLRSATNAMTCCLEFSFVIALWGKKQRIKWILQKQKLFLPRVTYNQSDLSWKSMVNSGLRVKSLGSWPFWSPWQFQLASHLQQRQGSNSDPVINAMALFSPPLKSCNWGSSKTCVWMLSATSLLKNTQGKHLWVYEGDLTISWELGHQLSVALLHAGLP